MAYTPQMVVTDADRSEWSRMAKDAYATGRNAIGHRFSVAAATRHCERIPLARFDSLQADYRRWLIDGWSAFDDGGAS